MNTPQQVFELGYKSTDNFMRLFMPRAAYARTPLFQHRIDDLLENKKVFRKGFIAPRGHAKSTKCSVAHPLKKACYSHPDKELYMTIISESQTQSIRFLNVIAWNIQNNPRIHSIFGDLTGSKWSENEITTTNNVRITARGTGQRIRGSISGTEGITRPNLIILDDFESETNSLTPEAVEKNKRWINRAVEPSLADDGVMIAVGTIYADGTYLSDIQQDPMWKVLYFQALMNEGQDGPGNIPIWPQRYSYQRLMEIKASYESRGDTASFYQEYMNIPVDPTTQVFRKSDFRYFEHEFKAVDGIQPTLFVRYDNGSVVRKPLYVTVGVDLAISESLRADFSVVLVMGQDSDGNRYILDYWRERTGDIDVIVDKIFEMSQSYAASLVNIETVQFQQAVANQFYKQMTERNYYVGLQETKPRTSKDARIRSLQPFYRAHTIFHRPWMAEIERELETYPKSASKDILDALYLADMYSNMPTIKSSNEVGMLKDLSRRSTRESVDWMLQ